MEVVGVGVTVETTVTVASSVRLGSGIGMKSVGCASGDAETSGMRAVCVAWDSCVVWSVTIAVVVTAIVAGVSSDLVIVWKTTVVVGIAAVVLPPSTFTTEYVTG